MRHVTVGALLVVLAAVPAPGQTRRDDLPKFNVASVKRCSQDDPAHFMQMIKVTGGTPNGGNRYYKPCITTWQLVTFAYDVPLGRLRKRPEWTGREYFEVDARTAVPVRTDVMRLMVRDLLADRFSFQSHAEMETLNLYALVLAVKDKGLGPSARPAAVDCSPDTVETLLDEKTQSHCAGGVATKNGVPISTYNGMTMSRFATTLSILRLENEIVVDETGLDGIFDLTLEESSVGFNTRDDAALNRALEKHLGLKLVRRKGPVEVLVIDRLERPTAN